MTALPENSIIVFMSGGPDSTATAWQALEEGHGVVGVHIVLPYGYRDNWRRRPCDRVGTYILGRHPIRFVYHQWHLGMTKEMMIRIGDGSLAASGDLWDWWYQLKRFIVATLMLAYPGTARVGYLPTSETEKLVLPLEWRTTDDTQRWQEGFERWTPPFARQPYTKRDVYKALPQNLWSQTVSCENSRDIAGHFIPCEVCPKCKERAASRKGES